MRESVMVASYNLTQLFLSKKLPTIVRNSIGKFSRDINSRHALLRPSKPPAARPQFSQCGAKSGPNSHGDQTPRSGLNVLESNYYKPVSSPVHAHDLL